MDTHINYTIVGAFVIFLLTAIVLGIIWLSSGFSFETYSTYAVFMQESASGLTPDSPVEYNGVSVGTLKSIELNPHNPQEVEVLLNIKSNTPITRGTVAILTTRGITGITYIALQDKGLDLKPLRVEAGQIYPVIKTAPSIFMRLDIALSQLTQNLRQITESLHTLLDEQNQQSIKDILFNLKVVTTTLSTNSQKLNLILGNTAKASEQFLPLLQFSANSAKLLDTQALPAAYHLISNLNNMTRSMAELSGEIKQNPSILIRGANPRPPGPGEQNEP